MSTAIATNEVKGTTRMTINGKTYTLPFRECVRPLTQQEYDELRESIKKFGIFVHIMVSVQDEILDGHHRLLIAQKLGITDIPCQVVEKTRGLEWQQRKEMAVELNAKRRHLSREEKQALITAKLLENPNASDNQIAGSIGASHVTAGKVRKRLEAAGTIPKATEIQSKDGKTRRRKAGRDPNSLPLPRMNTSNTQFTQKTRAEETSPVPDAGVVIEPSPVQISAHLPEDLPANDEPTYRDAADDISASTEGIKELHAPKFGREDLSFALDQNMNLLETSIRDLREVRSNSSDDPSAALQRTANNCRTISEELEKLATKVKNAH